MDRLFQPTRSRKNLMFNQLLPQRADNTYGGYRIALWIFALLVLIKAIIGANSIWHGHTVASSADGIPLDTFTPAGAQTVVSLFALLGLSQLTICLLCVIVLIRYRALIPLMFAVLLLDSLTRKLILHFLPTAETGSPPGFTLSLVLLAMMIVGLVLSLWSRGNIPARE